QTRHQHRDPHDGGRQKRRHNSSEDEERKEKQDREGEHLRAPEILADLRSYLIARDLAAAEPQCRVVREALLDAIRGVFPCRLPEWLERGGNVARSSVGGNKRTIMRVEVRVHSGDGIVLEKLACNCLALRLARAALHWARKPHERDCANRRILPRGALDFAACADALRAGVLEVLAPGGQLSGNRRPERYRDGDAGQDDQKRSPAMEQGEISEAGEQRRLPSR